MDETTTAARSTSTIGVVVPTHNSAPWLAATLETVLAQTHGELLCVVVDDGSADATAEIARGFVERDPRIQLLQQPQSGVSAARNAGLDLLRGRCGSVAFLDSDDLWLPDALERLHAVLAARPEVVGVTGTAELVDEAGEPVDPGLHTARMRTRLEVLNGALHVAATDHDTTFEMLAVAGRIFPPAVALLRADVVEAVHGFDETLTTAEDWDLFLRASRSGPIAFLDETIAMYRRRGGSLTADNYARAVYFIDVVRRKAWVAPENTSAQRAAVAAAWRAVQRRAFRHDAGQAVAELRERRWRPALRLAKNSGLLLVGSFADGPPAPQLKRGHRRTAMVSVVQPGQVTPGGARRPARR